MFFWMYTGEETPPLCLGSLQKEARTLDVNSGLEPPLYATITGETCMQKPSSFPDPVTIRAVPLAELEEFAARCRADSAGVMPISPARLRSQLHNPCAAGDDIVMVAAMCGPACVGYHGLLPGYLQHGGSLGKILWATTFFVIPEMRGRGVGKKLVEAIMELGADFAVTRMTEGAEKAYRSMGLQTLGYHEYRQLRADKLKGALTAESGCSSRPDTCSFRSSGGEVQIDTEPYAAAKEHLYGALLASDDLGRTVDYDEVPEIGRWPERDRLQPDISRFYRPVEVINWMLRFPWLFSHGESADDSKYYFSTTRELFTFKAFQIYEDDRSTAAGFVVLSILSHKGRTVVKLLDWFFRLREHEHMALVVALACARKYDADRIEYASRLHRFMPAVLTEKRLVKKQRRLFLYHPGAPDSPLAKAAGDIILDYCDGDVAFA